MGSQIGFYAADADYQELARMADEVGMVALPGRVPTEVAETYSLEAQSVAQFPKPAPAGAVFLLPSDLSIAEAFYRPIPSKPHLSNLDSFASPVIEFSPSPHEGDRIRPGRLFLDTNAGGSLHTCVRRRYDALVRRVKKWPRIGDHYVGPETLELMRAGTLKLMAGRRELSIGEVIGADAVPDAVK